MRQPERIRRTRTRQALCASRSEAVPRSTMPPSPSPARGRIWKSRDETNDRLGSSPDVPHQAVAS
jgi:hypothetical protein